METSNMRQAVTYSLTDCDQIYFFISNSFW